MLVMVVFFIAFRWIHLSTPLIRLFLLVLILLLMPTLNFLPVLFALSLLRFRLPSRLLMMFILWMVAMMVYVPNPDEAVPSFVSGAMAKAGKGLLEGTLQAGTSAVSDKLLDLVGLGGKSAADKGKDTR